MPLRLFQGSLALKKVTDAVLGAQKQNFEDLEHYSGGKYSNVNNCIGFLTYPSDFDYWPGHVGRPPTGLPPSSFGVKWGKGDGHQFLPALVTKLMDGTFICCSWFIQNWLCPKTFDPPSPHKNVQSYSDNPFVKLSKNVVIFMLHFPLKKLPHLILDKFQKNQFFSLMFFKGIIYPLLQLQKSVSATLRKAESIWGTRGKKND